jgi:hypothetical protein
MGCCLFAAILAGAPRIAFLTWWLFDPRRINATFHTAIWPLIGFFFLPWTTLMYVIVAPGGLSLVNWIFLGIALAVDLSTYGGGARSQMRRSS